MKRHVIPSLFVVIGLTACDPIYGPGLVNLSSHPIGFTATFSGRPMEVELKPKQDLWHRYRNITLDSLTITDGLDKRAYSRSEIEAALFQAGTNGQAAVAYLGGGRIAGVKAGSWRR